MEQFLRHNSCIYLTVCYQCSPELFAQIQKATELYWTQNQILQFDRKILLEREFFILMYRISKRASELVLQILMQCVMIGVETFRKKRNSSQMIVLQQSTTLSQQSQRVLSVVNGLEK